MPACWPVQRAGRCSMLDVAKTRRLMVAKWAPKPAIDGPIAASLQCDLPKNHFKVLPGVTSKNPGGTAIAQITTGLWPELPPRAHAEKSSQCRPNSQKPLPLLGLPRQTLGSKRRAAGLNACWGAHTSLLATSCHEAADLNTRSPCGWKACDQRGSRSERCGCCSSSASSCDGAPSSRRADLPHQGAHTCRLQ